MKGIVIARPNTKARQDITENASIKLFPYRLAFPDGQLRRVQSGVNVQYVLAGLKRRSNPLPVKSRTDSPASQQSSTASSHPSAQQAVQRMSPGQQSIGRTPTPPVQTQGSPAWNPAKQQNIVVSQQAHTPSKPRQVSSGSHQQTPGMGRMPRRASIPSQGAIQATPDQVSDRTMYLFKMMKVTLTLKTV